MLAEQAAVAAAAAAAAYAVAQENQSGSSNGVAAPKSAAKAKRALTSAGTPATKQKSRNLAAGFQVRSNAVTRSLLNFLVATLRTTTILSRTSVSLALALRLEK